MTSPLKEAWPWAAKEMQINTRVKHDYRPVRAASVQRVPPSHAGRDADRLNLSCAGGENVKWQLSSFSEVKNLATMIPSSHSASRLLPERHTDVCFYRHLRMSIHSNSVYRWSKPETTQVGLRSSTSSTGKWLKTRRVKCEEAHPCRGRPRTWRRADEQGEVCGRAGEGREGRLTYEQR